MGGLAALAREAGHKVTGCDTGVYPPMSDQLRGLGIELIEGYGADQMALAPDVFVIGNVVSRARLADGSPKYPLMEAILNSGQPYTSGPQWLSGHVLHHPTHHATGPRHVLAVAGTHGKTTTTAMLAWILECAGLQPGFLIGGVPLNFGVSARLGTGNAFVIEADEYDTAFFDKRSKFVHYRPRTAILNNLEFDHADIFDDLAAIERQFHHLVRTVPSQGRVVFNASEDSLQRVLAQGCWSEQVPFGGAPGHGGFTAQGEPDDFQVLKAGEAVARRAVGHQRRAQPAQRPGGHRGRRACGRGARRWPPRRWPHSRTSSGAWKCAAWCSALAARITVYDDFAHHPTAIHTTLDGLRRQLNSAGKSAERILAIFEPRSNTMKLGTMTAQLPWSLERADLAFCHAGGLDWDARAALAPMGERAQVADNLDAVAGAGQGRRPAGRPFAVHEQRRLWRHSCQIAGGAGAAMMPGGFTLAHNAIHLIATYARG